ncbi:PH domain-containing protein [Luteimonas aquatica]|uniref:PH domain-containing protein n=1 Tax=Luteimonas aquatica TaxID=450364 RepID=UPI003CE59A75
MAPTARHDDDWQPLPPRARALYILSTALGLGAAALLGVGVMSLSRLHLLAYFPLFFTLAAIAAGALYGNRRYVNTRWRLNADGFALQRGRLWQVETRVPGSRVQHLDLKRGPIERYCRLATLVIHTAGTRHSSVSLSGLDEHDAERLRDRLASQTDDDDDA